MRVPPPGTGAGRSRLPHAGELFTDRETESAAFAGALRSFRTMLDDEGEADDSRRNVLTYYGLGGIGKSALSRRLESWVLGELSVDDHWGASPVVGHVTTARIDLHGSAGQMDVLAALLSLRAGVAGLRRRWPVFDLAFTAYWSAVRPDDPVPAFRGRDELVDSVADIAKDVLSDAGGFADLVAPGVGAGMAVRGVRRIVGQLRRRRDLQLAVEAFPGFENFLVRCADEPTQTDPALELACEIAGTLAWELSTTTPSPLVVVFVDTTERLRIDPRRTSEGYLNLLVHHMPNVLFVMTGRDMLDWFSARRLELPYRGPAVWPGLQPGSTDHQQHLVGNLSPEDTRRVVLKGRRLLRLPMGDEVVEQLVTASGGLPQYLELARQVAISIKDQGDGGEVAVADVTGSMGSLVARVLEDIPEDEQRVLRAASLFRVFDVGLVAAAADAPLGCAERAVTRPMVDRTGGDVFPYRMHDAVREALRSAGHDVTGGWTAGDWRRAATRAVEAVRQRHAEAEAREDTRGVLDAVGLAISLVCEEQVELSAVSTTSRYVDWLARAIVFSPSFGGLRSRSPGASRTEYGRVVLEFIAGKSPEVPFEERLQLLRGVFDSDHPLRLPAGRHLGYALKVRARWDEALAVFDEVVAIDPSDLNRSQRPQTLSMARRFVTAQADSVGNPGEATVRRTGEYAHGLPQRYFAEIGEKLAGIRGQRRGREYLEDSGTLIERRALLRGDVTAEELEEFRDDVEVAGHVVAMRSALLATVLSRHVDDAERGAVLRRLEMSDSVNGTGLGLGFRYALAECCDAAVAGDDGRLRRLAAGVSALSFRSRSWVPLECFLGRLGHPVTQYPTEWLEPVEVIQDRWSMHLENYLAAHGRFLT